jgi:protein involved in ribonucleotide reduction
MLLVYMSMMGNVRDFVERVDMDSYELNPVNPPIEVNEDYIVVIPTYVGYINEDVEEFVEYKDNLKHLVGFASSGNINFDDDYCINGKELSAKYNKPLIFQFEFQGTDEDIIKFRKEVEIIEIARATKES